MFESDRVHVRYRNRGRPHPQSTKAAGYDCSIVVTPHQAEDDVHSSAEIVCVGVPLAHCTLSIRDDDGEELSTDHYGHITARGPMISPGYYGGTEARQNGWLDTGDLGFIHRGALYIAGRAKDTIIVNGVNYHPNDLERVCCAEARIETGKVTCCSVFDARLGREQVLVFVVHRQDFESFQPVIKAVRAALGRQALLEIDHVLPVKAMPKTTSGKVQRYRLVERFLQGEFDALIGSATTPDSISGGTDLEQMLLVLFNEIIPDVQVGLEDNFLEAGVSSLSLAEVAERLDEMYPDRLDLSDLLEYPTIPELAALLEKQIS